VGYARVPRANSNPSAQLAALKSAGASKTYLERSADNKTARPELEKMVRYLRPGDTLVVTSLDRLGSTVDQLTDVLGQVGERGAAFRVLDAEMAFAPLITTDRPQQTTMAAKGEPTDLMAPIAEPEPTELMAPKPVRRSGRKRAQLGD
jgi:DNA invertase Pin-like site-specific DNA recombinase